MTSETNTISTLQAEIKALSDNVNRLNASIEKNSEKLERIGILEVSHSHQDKAIERAFLAISTIERVVEAHLESNNKEHAQYNKWLYMAVGFCFAMSVLWTVVGYRMNAMIDEQISAVQEMKYHVRTDEITKHTDVQQDIRQHIQGSKP